jgi:hypothetical protein
MFPDPSSLVHNYMHENHQLMMKYSELLQTNELLQINIKMLNKYFETMYDLSGNIGSPCNINITSYDMCGNLLTCVTSDMSGNFIPCMGIDLHGNFLPCVLPPDLSGSHGTKSRGLPYYGYPFGYPYDYPYGYGYPYNYSNLLSDDDCYRDLPTPSTGSTAGKDRHLPYPYPYPYPYPTPYPYPYPYGDRFLFRDVPMTIHSIPGKMHSDIIARPVNPIPPIFKPQVIRTNPMSNVHVHIH